MKYEEPPREMRADHRQVKDSGGKGWTLKKAIIKIAHPKIIKNSHGQRKMKRIYGLEEGKGTPHWKYILYAIGKQRKSYRSF